MIEEKDQQLECTKCGNAFIFTAREARDFNEKGLTNVPKKCPACRAADRAKKATRTKFDVACVVCGNQFEVPFDPPRDAAGELMRPLRCIEHFETEPV